MSEECEGPLAREETSPRPETGSAEPVRDLAMEHQPTPATAASDPHTEAAVPTVAAQETSTPSQASHTKEDAPTSSDKAAPPASSAPVDSGIDAGSSSDFDQHDNGSVNFTIQPQRTDEEFSDEG